MSFKTSALRAGGFTTAALLALTACGGNGEDTETEEADGGAETAEGAEGNGETPDVTVEGDSVTVAIAGEEPYSWLEDGEPTGAALALAEEILGERMGYEVEAELTSWDTLIPGLNAGQWDVVSAGMSITPERCEQAAFSEPEIMYTTAFLVEEGNPHGLEDFEDVAEVQESEGLDVVTLTAGVEAGYTEALGIETEGVETAEDGVDFVTGGRADVFALTAISLNAMAGDIEGYEVTDPFSHEVSAGSTVFRFSDEDLLNEYNEHLAELKESGEMLEIISEFGFTEDEVPPAELTAAELCEGNVEELNEQYLD
ncbi:transporter substrate-binding domain-containing protein [Nesterenkonia sp.]|uniref:transporter substrate-binding domain-containing protein n=1 Tax=Nesterenkonia sp. TaxID=704201 RepID=UPI002625D31B|nr:transporter substrate-binding domain-containing protein [Nesterenkonia sp.]